MLSGSCQCGSVRFEVSAPLHDATACHCTQCRKQSGHYFASANVSKSAVRNLADETLTWYQASPRVRRGFCSRCGSWLFWEPLARDWTSIALGCIDGPTGVVLERHIFVGEMGDYYTISDGLPQVPR